MLAIAIGGRTMKMHQGHHGANHPVKDLTTGKVEITSMNHGFAVDGASLPANAVETHVSLFDGSNCGLALKDRPVFSVQYHPEASPGPRDSHGLFRRFVEQMRAAKRSCGQKVFEVRLGQDAIFPPPRAGEVARESAPVGASVRLRRAS
jgi:carbamoyl-phosphate synthase small subunit